MTIRRLTPYILEDLAEKMVFVAGPRQCGKTTLALKILEQMGGEYYNWDIAKHRKVIQNYELNAQAHLWVFDELHKFIKWRNWLKGVYDEHHLNHALMVTGSAKLDLYSRGGDSLQGRYFLHRLHPFTLSELAGTVFSNWKTVPELSLQQSKKTLQSLLFDLMALGGFPEPFLSGSARKSARWRLQYGTRLVQEEVRSLELVQDLGRLELLFDRLSATVGAPLSLNNLREDLEVAFETVRKWVMIFEKLYGIFRIYPFGSPQIKAVKKEAKLYFWDFARVGSESARFENLIALHLLRFAHWCEDLEGEKIELRYFRDVVGHEVDFILLKKGIPWMAVEAKTSDVPLHAGLKYLLERVQIPYAFQVSLKGEKDYSVSPIHGCKIRILPASLFLNNLP